MLADDLLRQAYIQLVNYNPDRAAAVREEIQKYLTEFDQPVDVHDIRAAANPRYKRLYQWLRNQHLESNDRQFVNYAHAVMSFLHRDTKHTNNILTAIEHTQRHDLKLENVVRVNFPDLHTELEAEIEGWRK